MSPKFYPKVYVYQHEEKVAQSGLIFKKPTVTVTGVKLTATTTGMLSEKAGGKYYLKTSSAGSWEEATSKVALSFAIPGTELYWKAVLWRNYNIFNPIITQLKIEVNPA